ncbi:MAG TPA: PEP/pyruvate-binding domain-containing protein [Candidatus Competibacter sp.]|nr:PEP/pyruvate-binding domain-containing protein [Candidatus Competibacter sp.]
MDTKQRFLPLLAALEKRGVEHDIREEVVADIMLHEIDLIYWNEADKERIALHAFLLARARSLLQDSLAKDPDSDGRDILEQHIREIDEHFSAHHWPTTISGDDPALLYQLWQQQKIARAATSRIADPTARSASVLGLRSENNRILRLLLKFPATVSPQGTFEPVETGDLAAALSRETNRYAKTVIVEELQARYPVAYDYLARLYEHRHIVRLDQLIDLKKMSSRGFLNSTIQTEIALITLIDNLTIAWKAIGKQELTRITGSWDSLNQIKLIAVQDFYNPGFNLGGYQLTYPVEYSESQMPLWMQDNTSGELRTENDSDIGTYILFSDTSSDTAINDEAKKKLREQYTHIQNHLIKPNYDALQLIVAHSDRMTKRTAQTIVSLLAAMVEAYRQVATPTKGDAVFKQYNSLARELDQSWEGLSQNEDLPAFLKNKIIKLTKSSLAKINTVHSMIRYLHEAGNKALEERMISARANITITVGRIRADETKEIRLAKLDDAPIIVNGLIRHRAIAAIVRAARRTPAPIPGTFIVTDRYIIYSTRLGEHRVEFSANIEQPDHEGFVRLQSYQGGVEIEQQLRGAFVEKVLKETGMTVQAKQDGLVDWLVSGVFDKDHGARTVKQIEHAAIRILRLIWSLRDLDYAMVYIFSREILSKSDGEKVTSGEINRFAASFATMFLVEGSIPLSYKGYGMPLAAYCEHVGPRILQEYQAYCSEERRMARHRLYFTINASLREVGLPTIKPGKGGIGQAIIDEYFGHPLRNALGRGELRCNARGFIEKNPDYQPSRDIVGTVVTHENQALRMAALLKMTDLYLDFNTIGGIDQLTLMRAEQEIAPNEWLVVYGLADEDNRTLLYAFSQYLTARGDGAWLSLAKLRKILRKAGFAAPAEIHVSGFQKTISHRMLIGQPRQQNRIIGTSIRGLSASIGDGSVRIGRITFDRNYYSNPETRIGRVLLVPFTTPEDIEAIRTAEAVLVTSGGLLSHAGVTTREFAIPALIIPHAEWMQSPEETVVRLEERHPGQMTKSVEGFWVSDSMVSETVEVRDGDMVLVWTSQGIVSIISMGGDYREQAYNLIQNILSGKNTFEDLEFWLEKISSSVDSHSHREQMIADILGLVLAESLWNKRISSTVRKQFIDVLQHACSGIRADGAPITLPTKSVAHINMIVKRLLEHTFRELEALLSEIENNLSRVKVLWRAVNIIAMIERQWAQAMTLITSLNLSNEQLRSFEHRIDQLRRHPRLALLKASVLHDVETLSARSLTEENLPLIRQTLRRLGYIKRQIIGPKILFVCTANVDRSPMAEFLLKKILFDKKIGGVDVTSRGVAATDNQPMSKIGQALLLAENGVHAETHCSKKIDETDVREADIILVMEQFHMQFLKEKYPFAIAKIHLLSDYGGIRELGDIKDPAGQPEEAHYRMKREMELSINGTLNRMREEGFLAKAMTAHLQAKASELAKAKRERIAKFRRAVLSLDEVDADTVELVGGKGANLGEIAHLARQHGAQVPQALMVTTFAFQQFLEENDLQDTHARISAAIDAILVTKPILDEDQRRQVVELSEQIRNLIFRGNLDATTGIGREIMEAVDACSLKNTSLSVRSSGLQEDTEEATFAGAAETYLYVNADELLERIKSVWMSFWLIRGLLYRSNRIIRQGPIKPAVVIQKMFDSQVSGVMFTTDPVSGRDVIVIEAGYGLGEGVVSGLVDVDRYYVNKFDGSVIDMHIGKKAFKVVPHPSGKGTAIEPVDNDLREVPCLTKEDIKIKIAMALEEYYALSQDIEFGIADGKVCILQTRPITTRLSSERTFPFAGAKV